MSLKTIFIIFLSLNIIVKKFSFKIIQLRYVMIKVVIIIVLKLDLIVDSR